VKALEPPGASRLEVSTNQTMRSTGDPRIWIVHTNIHAYPQAVGSGLNGALDTYTCTEIFKPHGIAAKGLSGT
jgi:hypothetical protein